MAKGYIHVETVLHQYSKKPGGPCGDAVEISRNENSTIIMLADGLGSGIKANIAATMCLSRLKELLRSGFSIRHAFKSVLDTMESAKVSNMPYAVFTIIKIMTDGIATILSYEMPPPLLLTKRTSSILQQRIFTINNSIIGESNCFVNPGEGIMILSDGLTNAGVGKQKTGWGIEGINNFIIKKLSDNNHFNSLPEIINNEAKKLWENSLYDDCTVVIAYCIKGKTINLLTGPPSDKSLDKKIVSDFLETDGTKVVCGGTTARLVSRYLNKALSMKDDFLSNITPPKYEIEGIDLVTEGAVTLNQVYNVWGEDGSELDKNNPVTELFKMLSSVDRVNFFVGKAENPTSRNIRYVQAGILKREKIVPLLSDKLRESGKLVTIEYY